MGGCRSTSVILGSYNLMEPNQSAYRTNQSAETILLKVKADILHVMDNQEIVFLVLLDLSAAFDTIDQTILLHSLKHGSTSLVQHWHGSNHTSPQDQHVIINDPQGQTKVTSLPMTLTFESPREVSFTQFCSPFTPPHWEISEETSSGSPSLCWWLKIYLSFKPIRNNNTPQETFIQRLEQCIEEVRTWMAFNLLKLNDNKRELIIFGTHNNLVRQIKFQFL